MCEKGQNISTSTSDTHWLYGQGQLKAQAGIEVLRQDIQKSCLDSFRSLFLPLPLNVLIFPQEDNALDHNKMLDIQ